MAEHKKGCA